MKKYLVIVLLSLPFLFSSCFKFENAELIAIKDVTYKEFKNNALRLDILTTINNPNRFKLKIKGGNIVLKLDDKTIGTVTQIEHIELAGRTQKDYQIQVTVEMQDSMSSLPALFRILMNETNRLNLSGSVQVKSLMYSKTITVDKLSFK